jgi:oligopeptide transport system ATP-binding protein
MSDRFSRSCASRYLTKEFRGRRWSAREQCQLGACRSINVSFEIGAGETLGLVGESGSGKSTTGRCILRLIEPTAGEVWFEGRNVSALDPAAFRALCRDMQIIFQDPFASLNPRMTVGAIIGEALTITACQLEQAFTNASWSCWKPSACRPITCAAIRTSSPAAAPAHRIARALAVEPKLIVCDEPVSALDVSIQAQVINLLEDLQQKFGLTYLFIAHDLSVVSISACASP